MHRRRSPSRRAVRSNPPRGRSVEPGRARRPRAPTSRGAVISDDGKTAFVSHAVGSNMSAVDLAKHDVKTVSLHGVIPGSEKQIAARKKSIAELAKTDPANAKTMLEDIASEEKKLRDG